MELKHIINMIPSESLKSAIKLADFRISDDCLFKIGYLYSKSLMDRISICDVFIDNVNDLCLNNQIKHIKNHLVRGLNDFKKYDENTIYLVRIVENTRIEHTYFSRSYEEAVDKLNAAYLCDFKDNGIYSEELDMSIIKRGIYPIDDSRWMDDLIEYLWFNNDFEIDNIYFANTGYDDLTFEEQNLIDHLEWTNINFPIFFKDGDLVKYKEKYGMILHDQEKYHNAIGYVVVLNQDILNEDIYNSNEDGMYEVLEHHKHVPFCELEVITPEYAPKNIKEKFKKLLDFYSKIRNK